MEYLIESCINRFIEVENGRQHILSFAKVLPKEVRENEDVAWILIEVAPEEDIIEVARMMPRELLLQGDVYDSLSCKLEIGEDSPLADFLLDLGLSYEKNSNPPLVIQSGVWCKNPEYVS
jgi:hypothetical protein